LLHRHSELTKRIIGCGFEVINELGSGFVESVYERALALVLHQQGLIFSVQRPVKVRFREHVVGDFVADLIVEETVLVELKATEALVPEHEAQVINYLKATGLEVGLLLNFGKSTLQIRRCYNPELRVGH